GAGRLSTVILRSPGRPVATSSSTALSNEASRTLMQSPDNRSGRDLLLDSDSDTGSLPGDHDAGDEDDLDEGHQPPPPPPVEVRTSAQFLNRKLLKQPVPIDETLAERATMFDRTIRDLWKVENGSCDSAVEKLKTYSFLEDNLYQFTCHITAVIA